MTTSQILRLSFGLAVAALLAGEAAAASRQPLIVAVATNFRHTFEELQSELEQQDLDITAIYASSGTLMQQIMHGAPFAVFLSADSRRPIALEAAGKVRAGSRHTYAIGKLALWSRESGAAPDKLLRQGARVALANPELAPYGQAAMETLTALGLWQTLPEKVYGRDIAQTFVFARTGHAQLAFVAASQLHSYQRLGGDAGSVWNIPPSYHKPIKQQLVIIDAALNVQAAGGGTRMVADNRAEDAARMVADGGARMEVNSATHMAARGTDQTTTLAAERLVARILSANSRAIIKSFGYEVAND